MHKGGTAALITQMAQIEVMLRYREQGPSQPATWTHPDILFNVRTDFRGPPQLRQLAERSAHDDLVVEGEGLRQRSDGEPFRLSGIVSGFDPQPCGGHHSCVCHGDAPPSGVPPWVAKCTHLRTKTCPELQLLFSLTR